MVYATENSKTKRHHGIFECPYCGKHFKALIYNVNKERVKSCGCQIGIKHGLWGHKLTSIRKAMINRCYKSNYKQYHLYGGRGITVCEEWRNDVVIFYNWAMANGYKDGLEIDRINNNGNYCPENCRWVPRYINSQNTRRKSSNKCGYRGVWKDGNRWDVAIFNNGVRHWLGSHATKEEAALAYNEFVIANHTYHPLNVIEQETVLT